MTTPAPREIALPFRLTRRQGRVYHSRARYLVLVAGRRFGKTVLAVQWLVAELLARGPDTLGYYVAPYRVMAKAIAWDMLLKVTRDIRVAKNETELSVTLFQGSRVALRGADDPETLEGVGLSAVVLDEFARMKLDAWQKSLRPALSDKGGRALFCGKPRGFNHLKEFYDRGQDRTANPEWESWLFTTLDGGHVPADDVAEARGTLPAKVYRQEYEATFESVAGRVYEDFTRRAHVVPASQVPHTFRRIVVGVDWGFVHPGTMIVVGQTGDGTRYVIHEEVHTGMVVDESGWLRVARALREKFYGRGPMECFAADPSQTGYIKALRTHLNHTPIVRDADNRVHEGIRRVSTALLPLGAGGERPALLVSDACPNTIREFETYVWKEVGGRPTENPVDVHDDCLDALRYAEMALPALVRD